MNQAGVDHFVLFSSWDYVTIAPYFSEQKKDVIAIKIIPDDIKRLTLVGKNSTFYPIYYGLGLKHNIERKDFEPDYKKEDYEYRLSLGTTIRDFSIGMLFRIKDDVFERIENEALVVEHSTENVPSLDFGIQAGFLKPNEYVYGFSLMGSKVGRENKNEGLGITDSLSSQIRFSLPNFFLYHINPENEIGYYMEPAFSIGKGTRKGSNVETKRDDLIIEVNNLSIYYSFDYSIKDISRLSISPEFLMDLDIKTLRDSFSEGSKQTSLKYSLGFAFPLVLNFYITKSKSLSFIIGFRPKINFLESSKVKGEVGPGNTQTKAGAQVDLTYRLGIRYIVFEGINIDFLSNTSDSLSDFRLSLEYTF